jgi:hypothetical protein
VQIPKVVTTPSRRPPRRTFRTTSMVSGPGLSVSAAAMNVKATTCESIMRLPPNQSAGFFLPCLRILRAHSNASRNFSSEA